MWSTSLFLPGLPGWEGQSNVRRVHPDCAGFPAHEILHIHRPAGKDVVNDPLEAQGAELRSDDREQGKKVFVDITGHGCVNCREMEARVWSAPEVLRRLKEDYVIASLYVDDKTRLPEEKWVATEDGKMLKDVGAISQWGYAQKRCKNRSKI